MEKRKDSFNVQLLIMITSMVIVIVFTFKNSNSQTTVTIGSMKDNTLYEEDSTRSNGAGQYFFAGKAAIDFKRRGVIAFDIAGNIPPCATITSVTLELHMSRTIADSVTVQLRKISKNWGEGASDAFGEEGTGTLAQPGDATWSYTYYDTAVWGRAGGDFSSTISAGVSVGGIGFYTWGSTSQMMNDVKDWLDNPSGNYGWLLLGDESAFPTAKRFDTKENDSVNFRPKLTITYNLISLSLNLTSIIEGFWDGASMVSDMAKVYLRSASSPYAKVDSSTSAFNSSGNGIFCFSNTGNGSYYIVVSHRNSIDTWSNLPQSFTNGVLKNYNFTIAATQAFGNNMVLKLGKYCIYSGDANKDGIVDITDAQNIDNDSYNFTKGYVPTDLNGDDFVDLADAGIENNNGFEFRSVIAP